MLDKEAIRLFGKRLGTEMPVQPAAPLPSDLLRLVEALRAGERGSAAAQSPNGHLRRAA